MRTLEARLVDDFRALRARDPVGAAYLLVPSRLLGAHLRRRVARALGGILNLHVLTLPELTEDVAALPLALAGRRPLPPVADRLLVDQAIRAAVPAAGGYFSAVAHLPRFPDALLHTLLDLKRAAVTPEALVAAAGEGDDGTKLRELGACYRAAEATMAEHRYYDASDLLAEAARLIQETPARLGAAAVFVFGFVELNSLEERLLAACGRAAPVERYVPDPGPALGGEATSVEIVAAPGEEREVREIARAILRHVAAGGRFDDVGLLLRQPGIYRAPIRDVFGAAGIPFSWEMAPPLGETHAGRSLALLGEVRRADFSRAAVLEFLTFADLPPGPGVSPAEWVRLSRDAGIVRGARAWRERLERLGARIGAVERAADEAEEADPRRVLDREALVALHRTVGVLIRGLTRLTDPGPIADQARALAATYRRLVRPSGEADQVARALAGLDELAPLEPRMPLDRFWALVEAVLGSPLDPGPAEREGRVFVGELGQSLGLDFPLTVLPGLVEGSFPAPARPDPILLDHERARLPGLPLAAARRDLDRLRFRLAVGSGARRLLLTYPRVEVGTGRPRVPSFFLLDLLTERTGRRHDFSALDAFVGHQRVPLHPAPPSAHETPIDEREWLISRGLLARTEPARRARLLQALPRAARGVAAIRAREHTAALTSHDGLLREGVGLGDEPLAATWLEIYAACPFKYFLGRVLGVARRDEAERSQTIAPADRGRLVHAALDTTFRRLRESGLLPITRERLALARATLDGVLDEAFPLAEARGLTGLPALWEGEQARLRAELHAALEAEADGGREWVPAAFEAGFGIPWLEASGPPLAYVLPDGTTLRLRGAIDRIDLSVDGTRARVIDYKTGRVRGGRSADRFQKGRALQLPLYRLAAEALVAAFGVRASVEEAQYYYVLGRDAGARIRFTRRGWENRREDFDRVLGLLVEGIRAGRFFARPEACGTRYPCDYDLACGAERRRWAAAKAADPAAARHAELEAIP